MAIGWLGTPGLGHITPGGVPGGAITMGWLGTGGGHTPTGGGGIGSELSMPG
jgi:hypothetical protein